MPHAPARGPEALNAALYIPATSAFASGEAMLSGESHKSQDNGGEAHFTEPSKKTGKTIHERLELEPPDSKNPEFRGGLQRQINSSDIKRKAVEYAPSVVEGREKPRGTAGLSYAIRALEFPKRQCWHNQQVFNYRSTCGTSCQGRRSPSVTSVSGHAAGPWCGTTTLSIRRPVQGVDGEVERHPVPPPRRHDPEVPALRWT